MHFQVEHAVPGDSHQKWPSSELRRSYGTCRFFHRARMIYLCSNTQYNNTIRRSTAGPQVLLARPSTRPENASKSVTFWRIFRSSTLYFLSFNSTPKKSMPAGFFSNSVSCQKKITSRKNITRRERSTNPSTFWVRERDQRSIRSRTINLQEGVLQEYSGESFCKHAPANNNW